MDGPAVLAQSIRGDLLTGLGKGKAMEKCQLKDLGQMLCPTSYMDTRSRNTEVGTFQPRGKGQKDVVQSLSCV